MAIQQNKAVLNKVVVTGIGAVSPLGVGKELFWKNILSGQNAITNLTRFSTDEFYSSKAAQIKDFNPKEILGPKGLRNLSYGILSLLAASKIALDDSGVFSFYSGEDIGVATATNFSHFEQIIEFDGQVLLEGLNAANPAIFPFTIINTASSVVSIRFNLQAFNVTITLAYNGGLEALAYAQAMLKADKAKAVLVSAMEVLTPSLYWGFNRLGYPAGKKGPQISCPFDQRHNGPILGEGAAVVCLEKYKDAQKRGAKIYAQIDSVRNYFEPFHVAKINPNAQGLIKAIKLSLQEANIAPNRIDCIYCAANSDPNQDRAEVKALHEIFSWDLASIPVTAIKSMLGEAWSVSNLFQLISAIASLEKGVIPPTINFNNFDQYCQGINLVVSPVKQKSINSVLLLGFGPGGYNGSAVISKFKGS